MEFAKKLKRLMRRRGLSQARLGLRLGVSQNLVGKWCRAESIPSLREAANLADEFGVDLNYLADDSQDEPPYRPAEIEAVKMVRSLNLDESEVIRRLAAGSSSLVINVPPIHETLPPSPTGTPAASPTLPVSGPKKSSR